MRSSLRNSISKKLQKLFWVYLTNNFYVTGMQDFKTVEPVVGFGFLPITNGNFFRVRDFRYEDRVLEYKRKLDQHEKGFFAESEGKMVGSIWATINNSAEPIVARTYMKLLPNEALVHDIVTGEAFRGRGIGPFMVGRISSVLLDELGVRKIIIDVNVRNSSSLRMMEKAGLTANEKMLSVSAFGRLISQKPLTQYR